MSKRRMIHEQFFQSEGVAHWTMRQRLLVIGMIALADDQGRLKANPFWLKARVFPYDMIAPDDIAGDLAAIAAANDTIRLYQVDGRAYIQLTHWWEYQNLQWAKPSDFPALDDWQDRIRELVYKPKHWVKTSNWPDSPDKLAYGSGETLGNELGNELGKPLPIINTNTIINTTKGGVGGKSHPDIYSEMIAYWAKCHPDKPQPRSDNNTLKSKVKTRMKSQHFKDNWRDAMERAARSKFLADGSFFDFGWFVANDDNYEKCLNGKYDDSKSSSNSSGPEVDEVMNFIKLHGPGDQPEYAGRIAKIVKLAGGLHALRGMKVYEARRALQLAAAEVPG